MVVYHLSRWLLASLDVAFPCAGLPTVRAESGGTHYVSLLFHAANAVLLFLLLQEATGLSWPSLLVAALFALHPINVESVAWAAERKNVLSMFFFLLAMMAYGRYARRGGGGRYALVALLFVLGMMAKPQIITLPCVLLLWDYWPLHRMFAKPADGNPANSIPPRSLTFLLMEKIPLFAIVGCGLNYHRQGAEVRRCRTVVLNSRSAHASKMQSFLMGTTWPTWCGLGTWRPCTRIREIRSQLAGHAERDLWCWD